MIRQSRILILLGEVFFFKISIILSQNMTCPFKLLFHISCPLCGMTRAFHAFYHQNFIQTLQYNILFLPILIILFLVNITIILEIIKNQDILRKYKQHLGQKKLPLAIICVFLLIISTIFNTYNRI